MAYTTIDKSTDNMRIQTWSGNNSADREITWTESDNMQPDFMWVKRRSDTANHRLADSVRGATKILRSDLQDAETTESDDTLSFDTNGFSVGNNSGVNKTGDTYVGWGWLAGGTASSNTDGSITSSVSVNTTAGFSIVSYTGTTGGASSTIGHGLGQTPDLVILKPRSYSGAWWWAQKDRANKVLELQAGNAEVDPATSFGGGGLKYSTFTSTVFGGTNGTSNDDLWNTDGATYIAYCFKSIKGYSKISTFEGNGSTDGTFLHCGFSPSFVIFKNADSSNKHWYMMDKKRSPINEANIVLAANYSNDEDWWGTGNKIDFLSNGIKIRSNSDINNSGNTFVFMAFADSPFVNSSGVPANAR